METPPEEFYNLPVVLAFNLLEEGLLVGRVDLDPQAPLLTW